MDIVGDLPYSDIDSNLGYYNTALDLTTAHPLARPGDYAIVSYTNSVWIWNNTDLEWQDSETIGTVTSVNGRTGAVTGLQENDATLDSLATLDNSLGFVTETAPDTFTKRTITGTAGNIVITNPVGTLGNPTFNIGSNVVTLAGVQTLSNKTISDTLTFNTSPSINTLLEKQVAWNDTDGTLNIGLKNGVTLQIGQEMNIYARNKEASTILNGQVVYVDDANVSQVRVKKASNNSATAIKTIAVATQDIITNTDGYVTTMGYVRDIDTHLFTDGQPIYLGVNGEITGTKPVPPAHCIEIGYCVLAHPSQGSLFIHISKLESGYGDYENGNYTNFEDDGTIKFNGNASTWVDIDFPIIIRGTGANIPVIATLQGNLTAPQWQVNDYAVCEGQELIHSWKESTPVYWHIHIYTGGTNTTDRYLKFEIEYTWANLDATLPANTVVTSSELLIPANTPALTHLIFTIADFTPTAGKIGAHVKARLKRVASTGTAPTANPFCEMLQLHIEQDTTGSRQISSK